MAKIGENLFRVRRMENLLSGVDTRHRIGFSESGFYVNSAQQCSSGGIPSRAVYTMDSASIFGLTYIKLYTSASNFFEIMASRLSTLTRQFDSSIRVSLIGSTPLAKRFNHWSNFQLFF